jgi:PAS domain S-box-containing protein
MTSHSDENADFGQCFWRSALPAAGRLEDLSPEIISNDQFRLLADNIPTLCWAANGDGYIVWYNRRWHEYCGTTPEEMEGWGWQSVHDPDLLPQVMERWTASIATGKPFEMTFPLRGADGTFRPFLTRIQPVRDTSGKVARWFGVNTEISSQVVAEAALRDSEARLAFLDRLGAATAPLADADAVLATTTRLLGEHLNLAICAYADMDDDQDGFTIRGDWAAPGSESIVGHYSLADFGKLAVKNLGAGLPLVVNDNLRELAPEEAATFQSIGIAATICMPLVKENRLTALMAIHDRVPRVWTDAELSLLREVTARSWAHVERVGAVAELRASEARLRALNETLEQEVTQRTAERNRVWEMSRDLLAVMGFDGFLKAINPAWTATLGLDADTLLSISCCDQVHPDDVQPITEQVERLARGETIERFENRVRHADGTWRWVSWTLVPEDDVFYAVGRDVTAEKEREAELEAAQDALRQSQKMEAMGQLTGGVAHDFNNLLTPIIGSLDLLLRKGLGTERERRLMDGALQSAERAKTLVQRLLAFARRQPLQPVPVDLGQLVPGMAELMGSTLGPAIDIKVELAPNLPPAQADPNQLEMALLNLAVNARDAMPGGGMLTVTAERASMRSPHPSGVKPGHYIRLAVRDTGEGMDAETLRRAVEPFFSTKGVGKGTGLGLSMVHGLVAQLGGGLTIHSTPGDGTTVELWLPLSAEPINGEQTRTLPVSAGTGRGTALLIDDEELVRHSIADMLGDLGFEVVEADSAEDALRQLDEGLQPNLLLTDHLMPGMTGADLVRRLRVDRPGLPTVIVSGYSEVEGIPTDIPRLSKPFRHADLAASLSALLMMEASTAGAAGSGQ